MNLNRKLGHPVSLGTRLAVIVGDVLVLLVTWAKTAQSYREARRLKVEAPLVTLLFLDGESTRTTYVFGLGYSTN